MIPAVLLKNPVFLFQLPVKFLFFLIVFLLKLVFC
jgi:hypothetical protein